MNTKEKSSRGKHRNDNGQFCRKHRKPRTKAIEHSVENITIEFTQRGRKRRLLRVQRYRKPVKIKDINLSKNPEKDSILVIRTSFGDRLEIYTYKNNPQKFFISINGEFVGLRHFKWREIQSAFMKLGKKLGFLK